MYSFPSIYSVSLDLHSFKFLIQLLLAFELIKIKRIIHCNIYGREGIYVIAHVYAEKA